MSASPTTLTMSVEEYLSTAFRPDVDYVDGHIEERNLGEWDHGRLQAALLRLLENREMDWGVNVAPEIRVQVSATRFRIPDVCVTDARFAVEQVIRRPPLLCVEVVSPEDRLTRVFERARDFHSMGVTRVWIFDPATGKVWVSSPNGVEEHLAGELSVPETRIVLDPQTAFDRAARRGTTS